MSGHAGGTCNCAEEDPGGVSLYGVIDRENVVGMNEAELGTCQHIIRPFCERLEKEPVCNSEEDDPEMIIHVPFTSSIKLKSISITGGFTGTENSPSRVKVYTNRTNISFSNVHDLTPIQELDLVQDSLEIGCVDYPVKPSSFQHVNNITLFFSDNFGGDHTSLSYLGFSGEDLKVKKGVVECVYESQANHADHPKAKDEDLKGGFSTGI